MLRHDALSGGAEASVGKITEILERRTGQHGWCDTEAIGFLPQAVGLSRCQCERQPHGTSLSREAWNRPTPAPPRRLRVRSGNVHVIVAAIGYRM